MIDFFWWVGAIILFMPVGLTLFTVFLMLTYQPDETDVIEYGSWLDEDDKKL